MTIDLDYNLFVDLVKEAILVLQEDTKQIEDALTTNRRLEEEFEHHVLIALKAVSRQSLFTFTKMPSKRSFPDILAEHQNGRCFGVEIKTSEKWRTLGNSINASITDGRIENIVVVFCKTSPPIEFECKPYEEAIMGIEVTHFPRYVLDMKGNAEKSILNHMNIPYSTFKNLDIKEKIALLKQYYEDTGKADNKWWIY